MTREQAGQKPVDKLMVADVEKTIIDEVEKKMKPIELWHGDCLELMKNIPDGSVDLVLTDPPYGTTDCKWDSVIPFEPMWEQLNRIIKPNGAICLFGSEPFSSALRMSNIKHYKYDWVWHKKNAGNILVAKYQPLKTTENIMVFSKKGKCNYYPILEEAERDRSKDAPTSQKTDLFSRVKSGKFKRGNNIGGKQRYPKHLIEFSNASRKNHFHPTQKPVTLLEYLIRTYTNEGETVLDFTAGSMSTVIACINTNRNCIAIEKDEHYFSVGCERVHNHILDNNIDEGYFNIAKKRIEEAYDKGTGG